jgi:hypothetical protein
MSKIFNVRLPDAFSPNYDPQKFNQLVRSLEQIVLQLNNTYTPVTSENTLGALSWFEARGETEMPPEIFSATSLDAFGRLRVANPYTLFDSQNRYQKDPQFSESLTGSATASFVANESSVDMSTTTASGDKAIRQTFRVFPYQPGKSLEVLATFVMNAGKENLRQRVGYFNPDNGVFFQVNGTTKSFVLRTNTSGTPSDTRTVNQADWNGDKLDGTGESGLTLDTTKAQILFMDFEWLGVGSVRCGFVINGKFILCHTFNNANDIDKVYMTTAILPVRYEIENTAATASSSTLTQICSTVISGGGYQQKNALTWARRTTTLTGVTTSFVPIVSIRLKSTALGAVVLPSIYSALPIGSTLDYEVALIKNPTLTGASFTSNSTNVEIDVTASALTGGTIIDLTYTSGSNQGSGTATGSTEYNFDNQIGVSIGGTSDIFTLAARTISGTDDIIGSLSYYDLTD